MFHYLVAFEIKRNIRRLSFWILFFIMFAIGFMALYRGSAGHGILVRLTGAGVGNVMANAPFAVFHLVTLISSIGVILTTAFFAGAAVRDYRSGFYLLSYSYPARKTAYHLSRFAGVFICMFIIYGGLGLGEITGSLFAQFPEAKLAPFRLITYLYPYFTVIIPNLLLTGAATYAVGILERRSISCYSVTILQIVLYSVALNLFRNLENMLAGCVLDPFGYLAAKNITDYWAVALKNTQLIPLSGYFLMNRILWSCLGVLILVLVIKNFRFQLPGERRRGKVIKIQAGNSTTDRNISSWQDYPRVLQRIDIASRLKQLADRTWLEFRSLINTRAFRIIFILGVFLVFFLGFRNVDIFRNQQTYPLTSRLLHSIKDSFYLFNLVVILFASGELVWRDRRRKSGEILASLPVSDWVLFFSKLLTLFLIQVLMAATIVTVGIFIQSGKGFYHYELGLYLQEIFGIRLLYFLLLSIIALFMQMLLLKRTLAYVITILLVDDFLPALGLDHHLWRFASLPDYIYSDMNGYGPYHASIIHYNIYWSVLAFILILLSLLLYVRGYRSRLKYRWHYGRKRCKGAIPVLLVTASVILLLAGVNIIYNTTGLNNFLDENKIKELQSDYEDKYLHFRGAFQPRIVAVDLKADFFPQEQLFTSYQRITTANKSATAINEVMLNFWIEGEVTINKAFPGEMLKHDIAQNVYIYALTEPLLPGSTLELEYNINIRQAGFRDRNFNVWMLDNGSFLNSQQVLPTIGYDEKRELEDNDQRRKFGLPPRQRIAPVDDLESRSNSYVCSDADWIDYTAVLGTDPDQVALTSGELLHHWQEGNRNYFEYRTERPILKFVPFISARYSVSADTVGGIAYEIYYHPDHCYNIERMLQAARTSLQTCQQAFSPYQFNHLRIVEFPCYQTFAQSFAGIIPFSEGFGFISRFVPGKVDYLSRVTAHEVGHQWWAHQVIGGNVQGATMLSEVMAQYSA
ncbi:MAG: hypothetical protein JXB60_06410, partial [Candidatus Cloacimonetes bacterium]|nr:hypothetical protein [Candidatus Cloacimonadota bacterium]